MFGHKLKIKIYYFHTFKLKHLNIMSFSVLSIHSISNKMTKLNQIVGLPDSNAPVQLSKRNRKPSEYA